MSWKDFRKKKPPFSMALDGYVKGGPRFSSKEGLRRNFNHHEGVDRLTTRATCGQVFIETQQGLFSYFQKNGEPEALVYVNDCDQDVCSSWMILDHPEMVREPINPRLNRLIRLVDKLDTTSGLCELPIKLPIFGELAWIFDPYLQFRLSGNIDNRNAFEFERTIREVERRILDHVAGVGESILVSVEYEVLGGKDHWAMIREIGSQARSAAFSKGIHALVTVRDRADGKFNYTFCRAGLFVPFDIPLILTTLNSIEGLTGKADCHGGCDMTGGTSRILGCAIPPKELECIINSLHK
ncbi:MAG: hypothetical protein HZA35_00360 [Parcubacteria group bacterium]|nr:hypothetical protein [Parcubacteria group bacterium]